VFIIVLNGFVTRAIVKVQAFSRTAAEAPNLRSLSSLCSRSRGDCVAISKSVRPCEVKRHPGRADYNHNFSGLAASIPSGHRIIEADGGFGLASLVTDCGR
jgi:hypothetical protein